MSIGQTPAPISQPEPETTPAPAPAPEPQADPAVQNAVQVLRAHGIPDKTIAQAIEAVQHGVPPEQVVSQLERLMSNGR